MSSSGQMSYHHSQPRPFRVPQQQPLPQTPNYHNPYNNPYSGFYASSGVDRQLAVNTGFRPSLNMPGFSQLTNSALVDALLTPSANEQEREHRTPPYLTPFQEPQTSLKRSQPSMAAWSDESDTGEQESFVEERRQTKTANDNKSKKRKRNSVAQLPPDDDYVDTAHLSDETPVRTRKPRRSSRSKKSPAPDGFLTPEEDNPRSAQKQSMPKKSVTTKRQKRPAPGRLIRKKPIGIAVPKTLAEAGPADRMMWVWKNQGRNWEEIRNEWRRITGQEPGGSSLSVRYIKLLENLARNGAASDIELLRFKKEAEEELLSQVWSKVAEKMLAYSEESEHNPKDLQKRYNMIVKSGYDVEKLLEDDDKRRAGQEPNVTRASTADNKQYEGSLQIGPSTMPAYNDPVANETAARVREQESRHIDKGDAHAYQNELSRASESHMGSADVYESVRILQEQVDGLNEQGFIQDIKYNVENVQTTGSAVPGYDLPSDDPFTSERPVSNHPTGQCLPSMNPLVNYDSDSE